MNDLCGIRTIYDLIRTIYDTFRTNFVFTAEVLIQRLTYFGAVNCDSTSIMAVEARDRDRLHMQFSMAVMECLLVFVVVFHFSIQEELAVKLKRP